MVLVEPVLVLKDSEEAVNFRTAAATSSKGLRTELSGWSRMAAMACSYRSTSSWAWRALSVRAFIVVVGRKLLLSSNHQPRSPPNLTCNGQRRTARTPGYVLHTSLHSRRVLTAVLRAPLAAVSRAAYGELASSSSPSFLVLSSFADLLALPSPRS